MIRKDLSELTSMDLYSLSMFLLYKLQDIPTYRTLSELPYILDKDNLLKLCEYYGGQTIRIPTTSELYQILDVIVLYQKVNLEGMPFDDALKSLPDTFGVKASKIKSTYYKLCEVLKYYEIQPRDRYL